MKILILSVRKLPFDVMASGEKKQEFREPSKWILSRIKNGVDGILFVNGYGKKCPRILVEVSSYRTGITPRTMKYSNGLVVNVKKETIVFELAKLETDRSNIDKIMQLYYTNKNKTKIIKAA